jgi:hypothetical protein
MPKEGQKCYYHEIQQKKLYSYYHEIQQKNYIHKASIVMILCLDLHALLQQMTSSSQSLPYIA